MNSWFESGIIPRQLLIFTTAALISAPLFARAEEKRKVDKAAVKEATEHMKEELGVNQFTTPMIETVLMALTELRPIVYEKVARELPDAAPADRARLAMNTGALIADGFLAVSAEKQSRLDDIGRLLIRHAKGLGVGDHITRHSKSILEKGAQKDWVGIRSELVATQRDVEKAMMALKDEEIAHLVALGGWTRGLEISSTLVADSYTPDRASLLVQAPVLDYFADRVASLNPSLKSTALFSLVSKNLGEIRELAVKENKQPPTAEELKKIRDLARGIVSLVGTPEE
jgi:hypothetical protein